MRQTYELSEAELKALLEEMRPDPLIYGDEGVPLFRSQQQKANDAWADLGRKLRFDWSTVQPAEGGERFFTAEPLPESAEKKE